MTGGLLPLIPLRAELQARIRDFLTRKAQRLPARLEAFLHTLKVERLKSSLRAVLHQFRREGRGDPRWDSMVERIHQAGRRGTIEGYPSFLFTVDLRL
jgi:hypothetical protein